MTAPAQITVVIPTLGRAGLLARVLEHLEQQSVAAASFEVVVVADAQERGLAELDRATAGRSFSVRRLQAQVPGASAARNVGWRAACAPLVLFLDDDILPGRDLLGEHLEWHRRAGAPEVGVLGHVRWAQELRVTPFMRWLEHGIQFDYPSIKATEASWGYFYTANASVKRELLERVGGFAEQALPFGYEDLDLALRMHRLAAFRLLYNRAADAEHLHAMDLEFWKRRMARIAASERRFVALHPEVPAYFHEMFTAARQQAPARGYGRHLAAWVPRRVPVVGPRVWRSADRYYRQALAQPFLEAWAQAGVGTDQSSSGREDAVSSSGS